MARRVLITGATGFTGIHLSHDLTRAGWDVYGCGPSATGDDPRQLAADLSDEDSLRRVVAAVQPHAVVHLAAVAFVAHSDARAFYEVNLIGSRNLLSALATDARQLDAVLIASSANVYGNASTGVLTEDSPVSPENDYAVSKLSMEYMARTWRQRLPLFIVRPFNYTGAGQSEQFLVPKIVGHFKRRQPSIELGNLDVERDFNDVRAVAVAYRRLLDARPIGETINICTGRLIALREVIHQVERLAGYAIEVRDNPAFKRPNEIRSLCGDPAKLRAVIGDWQPPPFDETLAWMLATPG